MYMRSKNMENYINIGITILIPILIIFILIYFPSLVVLGILIVLDVWFIIGEL